MDYKEKSVNDLLHETSNDNMMNLIMHPSSHNHNKIGHANSNISNYRQYTCNTADKKIWHLMLEVLLAYRFIFVVKITLQQICFSYIHTVYNHILWEWNNNQIKNVYPANKQCCRQKKVRIVIKGTGSIIIMHGYYSSVHVR